MCWCELSTWQHSTIQSNFSCFSFLNGRYIIRPEVRTPEYRFVLKASCECVGRSCEAGVRWGCQHLCRNRWRRCDVSITTFYSVIKRIFCSVSESTAPTTVVADAPVPVKKANRCHMCKKRVGLTGECISQRLNISEWPSCDYCIIETFLIFQVSRVDAEDCTAENIAMTKLTTVNLITRRWSAKLSEKTILSSCRIKSREFKCLLRPGVAREHNRLPSFPNIPATSLKRRFLCNANQF